jgi:hypothetical protein
MAVSNWKMNVPASQAKSVQDEYGLPAATAMFEAQSQNYNGTTAGTLDKLQIVKYVGSPTAATEFDKLDAGALSIDSTSGVIYIKVSAAGATAAWKTVTGS